MSLERLWFSKAACRIFILMFTASVLAGCGRGKQTEKQPASTSKTVTEDTSEVSAEEVSTGKREEVDQIEENMRLYVNDEELTVSWEDNEAVDALKELVSEEPLTVEMSMYGGFEQVGAIGQELPENDRQITTGAGDIVLYQGDRVVVFYGSNSWSYTRLGHIDNKTAEELARILGKDNVTITVSLQN